jgi:hypothetical protein
MSFVQKEAQKMASLLPNPYLQKVIDKFLEREYLNHKKQFPCGCSLCKMMSEVSYHTNELRKCDSSTSVSFQYHFRKWFEAKAERNRLKGRISSYLNY